MNLWLPVGFFVLLIIALIITLVVLNRGNTLDIIASLPNYKIFYPAGNAYLQLKNVDNGDSAFNTPPFSLPIGNPFWADQVVVNNTDSLNSWVIEEVTTTAFDVLPINTKLVKIVNVIYNETGIGYFPQSPTGPPTPPSQSKIGYLYGNIVIYKDKLPYGNGFSVDGSQAVGIVLLYVTTGTNTFQLKKPDGSTGIVIENGVMVLPLSAPKELATFQLVL